MNTKMKLAVAALAMVAAGQASAALYDGSQGAAGSGPAGSGSLILSVWDDVAKVSYTRDLGFTLNTFLPSNVTTLAGDGSVTGNKTPEAGFNFSSAGDSLFANTFAGSTQSNLKWNVTAMDSVTGGTGVARVATTTTKDVAPIMNNNGTTQAAGGYNTMINALNTNWGCGTASSCAVNESTANGYANKGFGENLNGTLTGASSAGGIGQTLDFWYLVRTTGSGSGFTATNKTQYGNSAHKATWTLAANGSLEYSLAPAAAVPVPGAALLLGSGLLGLVGVSRRKNRA